MAEWALIVVAAARVAVPSAIFPLLHFIRRTAETLHHIHLLLVQKFIKCCPHQRRGEKTCNGFGSGFQKSPGECERLIAFLALVANSSPITFILFISSLFTAIYFLAGFTILTISPLVVLQCDFARMTATIAPRFIPTPCTSFRIRSTTEWTAKTAVLLF